MPVKGLWGEGKKKFDRWQRGGAQGLQEKPQRPRTRVSEREVGGGMCGREVGNGEGVW